MRRSDPITIDGRLDEATWTAATKYSGFVQRYPTFAAAPTVETRFAIVHDDEAMFVGVWAGKVAITAIGWTAEYRIPLSQLRFASSDVQEWGFQVVRTLGRTGLCAKSTKSREVRAWLSSSRSWSVAIAQCAIA